jgi:hypothetical protein
MLLSLAGCGTTRSTDTARSATEQLLISDAIDQAVQTVDFSALRGQSVYLDDSRLTDTVDRDYLISTLRQHLLGSGCALRDQFEDADFVVEARAGAVGTDRNDLLFGVPSMNVPQIMPAQPTPAAIPEIPLAKRRDQHGVAKIAVFAYHRRTGSPVWQSGLAQRESSSNDVWILGAGPFQRGTIYEGTAFAGQALGTTAQQAIASFEAKPAVSLHDQKRFASPEQLVAAQTRTPELITPQAETPALAAAPVAAVQPPAGPLAVIQEQATSDVESHDVARSTRNAPYANLFSAPLQRPNQGLAAQASDNSTYENADRYASPPLPSGPAGE